LLLEYVSFGEAYFGR